MKKIVFITGSTRGIGKATAYKFAENGFTVILHGLNKTDSSEKLVRDMKKLSPESKIFYFDVSIEKQVIIQCQKILSTYTKIDILINNAGILKDKTFIKMTTNEWDTVIKTNLYGTYYVTKQFLPKMIDNRYGKIINISSIIGVTGNYGQSNYAASKAGIIALTKSLAKETAKYNITVNAVLPGVVDTEILKNVPEELMKKILDNIPLRRLASPEEISDLIFFLASDKSNYITGNAININGGWL
jgi:3-oxoacyl-[acyl-carrier protein] reductase